jgi:hypothetical protein
VSAVEDVDRLIERFHLAQEEFVKGNPEPTQELFSRREDATLANPLALQRVEGMRSQRP